MSDTRLNIGWAQADITPDEPVLIAGQFHARVSEGVRDPLTATALVLERGARHVVLVSCDIINVKDELREAVAHRLTGPAPEALVMNATHTHAAPLMRPGDDVTAQEYYGVELPVMSLASYLEFAADRIAGAVEDAWSRRAEGAIAFGLGHAVVGRNRRWVDVHGNSTMYGDTDTPEFSHIEGYEDHSVNVLATYDTAGQPTGVVVNLPCPSQATGGIFEISADFWHETREELRDRLGAGLFVLPQASAAGDQSPHLLYGKREHERMLELKGRTSREEIANHIADAVEEALGFIGDTRDDSPLLRHEVLELKLPLRKLTEQDVRQAEEDAEPWQEKYQAELRRVEQSRELREDPRWYVPVSRAWRKVKWHERVRNRFEQQQRDPFEYVTLHVIRLGEVAIATNPFEYYLDFGVYIKARSPAVQTFLVQLAGPGSYVPSARSTEGGGYGSVPASTPIGPAGGRKVADRTIDTLLSLWDEEPTDANPQ